MLFDILKNKKKNQNDFILIIRTSRWNESACKTRHKTKYDADNQGFGQITIDIQFGFFSGFTYF